MSDLVRTPTASIGWPTVLIASAVGPLHFAWCHAATGSYALVLWTLVPLVLGLVAVRVGFPALPMIGVQPRMA